MTLRRPPIWPDPDDALLLRAALLDGVDAIMAWREWHAGACYDPIDYTQQRVLPLLYNNLRRLGINDLIMDRYRRELRNFWAINQQLYAFAAKNIRVLEQQNIRSIVLKGIPLSHCYYAHAGLRPMSDVDILVHREDAEAATRYFKNDLGLDVNDIDGARIEFDDGWGLVRASNTSPMLVMRAEANTKKRLKEICALVEGKVERPHGVLN